MITNHQDTDLVTARDNYLVDLVQHLQDGWTKIDDTIAALDEAWQRIHTCPAAELPVALYELVEWQDKARNLEHTAKKLHRDAEQLDQLRRGDDVVAFDYPRRKTTSWPAYDSHDTMARVVRGRIGIDLTELKTMCQQRAFSSNSFDRSHPTDRIGAVVQHQETHLVEAIAARRSAIGADSDADLDEVRAELTAAEKDAEAMRRELSIAQADTQQLRHERDRVVNEKQQLVADLAAMKAAAESHTNIEPSHSIDEMGRRIAALRAEIARVDTKAGLAAPTTAAAAGTAVAAGIVTQLDGAAEVLGWGAAGVATLAVAVLGAVVVPRLQAGGSIGVIGQPPASDNTALAAELLDEQATLAGILRRKNRVLRAGFAGIAIAAVLAVATVITTGIGL